MVMRLVRDDDDGQRPQAPRRASVLASRRGGGPRLVRDSVNGPFKAPAGDVETVQGTMASEVSEEEELSAPATGAVDVEPDVEAEHPDGSVEQSADAGGEDADGSDQGASEAVAVNLGAMEALLLSTHHPLTA